MNKKLISTALSALLVFAFVPAAFAATASTASSNASIIFTPGTGVTDPLDPTDPTKPLDPIGQGTGNSGPLSLDYVAPFAFGTHVISAQAAKYESTNLKPFIQVTDTRGSGAGWVVNASMSKFSDGTNNTLNGAVLTLKGGEAISPGIAAAPTAATTVTLPSDGTSAQVVSAPVDKGLGTWLDRWFPAAGDTTTNSNVTLDVAAGTATVGTHTATITWTLSDAPGM